MKKLMMLAAMGLIAGVVLAGGHKAPITGSFVGGSCSVTNRDLMCEVAGIVLTTKRADFTTAPILIELINYAGITNPLTPTYGTAIHTQSIAWADGGASFAWIQGGKIRFQCTQTDTVDYVIYTRD